MTIVSLDWKLEVASVTDGDTIRGHLSRELPVTNGWSQTLHTTNPKGYPLRLVILNTPERGQPGYVEARADLARWLELRRGRLRVETYESAGWDRLLADIYGEGDRSDTASQWMLLQGWASYLG